MKYGLKKSLNLTRFFCHSKKPLTANKINLFPSLFKEDGTKNLTRTEKSQKGKKREREASDIARNWVNSRDKKGFTHLDLTAN